MSIQKKKENVPSLINVTYLQIKKIVAGERFIGKCASFNVNVNLRVL